MELDDLLTRAMARQTPKPVRRKREDLITAKQLAEADARMKARFTDMANWTLTRTVALVHEESNTLLGNFEEYTHNLTTGCRKLVRVNAPAPVPTIEYVTGDSWLNRPDIDAPKPEEFAAEDEQEAIVDLHMPEMDNVFAPQVLVRVILHYGSVARVELMQETRFYSKDKRVQVILPEDMDVREGLSLETRVRIKEFLGI